jgi:hypothetical protein
VEYGDCAGRGELAEGAEEEEEGEAVEARGGGRSWWKQELRQS